MAFTKDFEEYLDSLPDDELLGYLLLRWTQTIPIWERCTKEEYDKYNQDYDITTDDGLLKTIENIDAMFQYRRVPIWRNGGGLLDQISGREPDDYYYEKMVGEKKCIMVGGDMMDYINKRQLIQKFKL